ncbi:MAG: hypothetical protein CSA42_00990, partial [Gammaproteobacteria bacterium]
DDNPHGSFGYELSENGLTAPADVNVRTQNSDTVTGTKAAETLIGRADEDDTLLGKGGNDILQGRSGDDTLTGGSGNDIFIWTADDKGSVGSPDTDTVTDFGTGDDKLNLSDLLSFNVYV